MKVTTQQKKEIAELEAWFASELVRLKKKELDIMKRYDKKKSELKRQKVLKKLASF